MSEEDRQRWNTAWARAPRREVSTFLRSLDAVLPRVGRALDVAGGQGQDAHWLAQRGLEVTLVDVSDVALAQAKVRGVQLDLEREPLPPGPWDVIVCFNFLLRPLFEQFPRALAPGGWLVFAHPTRKNLERNPKPSARFILEEGELRGLVHGLDVVSCTEGWTEEGRHEARLVARRP